MSTVNALLYYSAPLVEHGREDDWVIDAVSAPPEVLYNFRKIAIEAEITNLRESADFHPTLDRAGFEMLAAPSRVDQSALLDGSTSSLEAYQHETEALLKSLTNADAVVFFDATFRREDASAPAESTNIRSAHLRVHVDQNPRSARARAINHGGADARRFRRFQIINIWRPLIEPVRNFPLAFCDYASIDPAADLVPTRLNYPEWLKDRENYSLKHSSAHRWYYWEALSPDEVVIFKCYDSACRDLPSIGDGDTHDMSMDVAGLCPHTAFFDENGPRTGRLRTSLEMRALLFYV